MAQALNAQVVEGVGEAGLAPVQHVIVGQGASVDAGAQEHGQVGRVHAVMNALELRLASAGYRCFQIDQAQVRLALTQRPQRHAPDIIELHRPGHWPVAPFRQLHIVAGILDPGFVEPGVARVRHDLINATGQHQVAGQKQPAFGCAT